MTLPTSIKALIDRLASLPSIGPRQATRLALYLVNLGKDEIHALSRILDGIASVKLCERCFFMHENAGPLCSICSDTNRDQGTILVVEKETDLLSIENTKKFTGRYLIVGPIGKIGLLEEWQKRRLATLQSFIAAELGGKAREIILGFNPTSAGDFNAATIMKELTPLTERMSRLGRGLPTGGEIEFADDETLGSAIERRS